MNVLATAATALLAAPPAGVAALLAHRAVHRVRAARRLRITTPGGIDEQGYVRINGLDHWVSVRGENVGANPVVLELHGGPGASNSPYANRTRSWERHFTVVRWDMRGTGRTLGHSGADAQGELTFPQLLADALEMTHHVRERLGVDRVILLANSYGTAFGLRLARSHPHLYSAYVGTDQNIHTAHGENTAHAALLTRLRDAGKHKQLATVEAMGPDARHWTARQRADFAKLTVGSDPFTLRVFKSVVLKSLWLSPLHTLRDLSCFLKGQTLSERITEDTGDFDDRADGTRFELPFFVFQGDRDVITPPEAAKAYFDEVQAPHKEFVHLRQASHFASFHHPDRFLDLLLTKVLPVVTADGATPRPAPATV
ncbi:proline iminopeptidase [Streptomyces spiroverticillatus]|uniref:Proline iminopeptidase n=1 Tax=Streptomyces finlayi TaxID=67296 RepID=A0A918WY71_9ACTN|nr:alpha/beta hydrolase [Streptomyces finlayi]GHA11208.1 proline iminopeptidase [Streptomyces spiroverticillatus]GHC95120.1 proline iminopeptidase [Streptomyces finlayi]